MTKDRMHTFAQLAQRAAEDEPAPVAVVGAVRARLAEAPAAPPLFSDLVLGFCGAGGLVLAAVLVALAVDYWNNASDPVGTLVALSTGVMR